MKKFFALAVALLTLTVCSCVSECSYCGGSGNCPNCNGTGKVAYVLKCGECNGSGKCQSCNGRGYAANMDRPGAEAKLRQLEFCGILLQPSEAEAGRR